MFQSTSNRVPQPSAATANLGRLFLQTMRAIVARTAGETDGGRRASPVVSSRVRIAAAAPTPCAEAQAEPPAPRAEAQETYPVLLQSPALAHWSKAKCDEDEFNRRQYSPAAASRPATWRAVA